MVKIALMWCYMGVYNIAHQWIVLHDKILFYFHFQAGKKGVPEFLGERKNMNRRRLCYQELGKHPKLFGPPSQFQCLFQWGYPWKFPFLLKNQLNKKG